MRVGFIGHRHIFDSTLKNRLHFAIENEIKNGCKHFIMGTHGDFDALSLSVCKELRKKYNDIIIEVVILSLNQIKPIIIKDKIFGCKKDTPYSDVSTIMYNIEDVYFKRKIVESNKKMIDNCDVLICYVDTKYKYSSGAKTIFNYAKKHNLKIINLFENAN